MFTKKDIKKEILNLPLGKDPYIMYAWDLLTEEMFQKEFSLSEFYSYRILCKPFASEQEDCEFTFRFHPQDEPPKEFAEEVKTFIIDNIILELGLLLNNKRPLLEILDTYAEPLYGLKLSPEDLYLLLSFMHHYYYRFNFDKLDNESISEWGKRIYTLFISTK